MTDSLESKLQFEIALYGAKGCPISDLWSVLVREQNITVKQAQANELWKKLVTSKDFEFIKEPEKKKLVEMMNVSYNTVLQEYGSTLHIVMVQEARRKTLTPSSAKKTLAPNHFLALERIIDAGRQGITQAQLARDIGTNAAGIYESVKKLEKLELITRHRSSYPGGYTNICYYTRYSPRNEAEQDATAVSTKGSIPYDLALSKVLKMLEDAQDNILPLREVVHRLHEENQYGKKWIRGICDMGEKRGYVQKVKVISGNEQQRCLKLLKTLSQADEASTSSSSAESASEQRSNATDMHTQAESTDNAAAEGAAVTNSSQIEKGIVIPAHMRNELVIEHVKKSGENGITQQELEQLLNGCPNLRRNLRRCEAKGIIVSIVEVQGRLRRYRYFDPEGLRKYQQTQNVDNMANNADPSINSTNSNNSSSNDMDGRYLQERKRPIEDGDQTVGDKRASKKQRTVEEKKTLGKRKRSDNVRENEDDAGNTNSDKFVRQQRTGMKASGSVMTQAARRKKALASIISRDKVREANDELAAEVSRAASDSSDAPNMARATLIKFAESLHLSGEIVVVRTMIPNLIGVPESKVLFLRPDISKDDQLVQQCLEHSRMSFAVKQQSNKRQVPEIHADLPPQRQQSASQDVVRLAPGLYWHELALRHGWIQSKFLRARALHEFLWESFHQEQLRRFNLAQVLINMPLSLYCRIIGIAFYSEAVEEFMQNNDQDMTLSQMPTDIRAKMVKRIHRLRNSLRTLIGILMALELLALVDEDPKNGGLYQLSDVGKVKNYSSKERPLLQEFRLQTQQDVVSFWKELQYVCMYMPSRQSDLAECGVNDALYAITLPRSWDSGSLLTIEQRKTLDSHADKTQGKVPLDDSRLISSLARELGISTHRVRRYYEVIVEAYEKRKGKTIRLRKRVPARNGRASSTALRSGQSDAQDAGEENSEGQKTPISTRKFSEHSRRRDTETWTRKNGQGPPWTETEISILLHAYAIMRHRSRGNARNVNWALLHSLFPKRSRRACKHCLYSLRWTRPATHQQLEELKAEWTQIYEQGIANGEIVDERPWDTENFDFYGHLEYFMRIMREKPEACTRTVALPAHVDEVKYEYQAPSSRQEQVLIGVRSMTVDRIQDILMDEQFLLVTTIIKMIVLSPKDEYTSEAGYSLLRPFNAELITRAISYLRKMGVLMRSKLRLDSRLPGRRFYVAQRFEKNLNEGTIPFKTFQEANHFATNVDPSATLDYSVTGGGMMALLSMLSEGRICLDMKNSEEYLKIRQTNFYPRLGHESLQNQWIDHGFQLMAKSIRDNPRPIDKTTLSSCPQPRREDVQLNTREQAENLLSDQTEHILYCEIRECKENGMTHCQIKERACKLGIHDEEIVAQLLSSLLDSSTVLKVGLSAERYVASEFAGPWLARAMKPSSEGIVEYYKPRMWCDVHGNTMTDILQKCGKMLLADIMDYPGISLDKLCIKYEGQMTRGEVVDLLERAEKVGVVKSQRLKPKAFASQTSWFTKPSSRIVTDEIYCYWPGKSCYSKLFDLQ